MSGSDEREHSGTFAEGQKVLSHTEADHDAGHFSEGQEKDHDALASMMGSFSEAVLQGHAEHERMGSFADSDCPVCRAKAAAANAAS